MRIESIALKTACLAALAAGTLWNVRLTIADTLARPQRPDLLRRAMAFSPTDAELPARFAANIFSTDPGTATDMFRRAVRLNSYDSKSWIRLGLLYEGDRNLSEAEASLLRASQVDSTFAPAWSLANFYFRHGRTEGFWHWAQKAAAMSPDDPSALFRLAWYVSPNVMEIESRLGINSPESQIQFVNFLMTQDDAMAVHQAADRLLATGDANAAETVSSACDWLIQRRRLDLALLLWNGLAQRSQIPWQPIAPASSNVVTNGGFARAPSSRGFDWRMLNPNGVDDYLDANPNALGFEFSGDEAEHLLIMYEIVPLQPQQQYLLSVDYSTQNIPPGSGLEFVVSRLGTGEVLARTGSLYAETDGSNHDCFAAPNDVYFVNLALQYQRAPGTVPVEGKIAIRQVSLLPVNSAACREKTAS